MVDGRRVVCIGDHFDLERQCPILVRESYQGLWTHLWNNYLKLDVGARESWGSTIIYGHPGIGKSVALRYLMCATASVMLDVDFTTQPVKHDDGKMYWHPLAVFRHLGPNLHVALKPVLWTSGDPLELFPGSQWKSILACAADALKVLPRGQPNKPVGELELPGTSLFHTFFFERASDSGEPLSHHPPANYDVPTPFLRGLLMHGMRTMQLSQRLETICRLQDPYGDGGYLRGAVYEAAAVAHMTDAHVKAISPILIHRRS